MRLDKVYIDGFKNLKQLEIDFDESRLTTVLIGQNGAGKSNLIEAITQIFRWVDISRHEPHFKYRVDYRIDDKQVTLSNLTGEPAIAVDGKEVSLIEFERNKSEWFPDLIFGYYSGGNRNLELIFDAHQAKYYKAIARNNDEVSCHEALLERRLFYCRPVHGALALLALFAFPDEAVIRELQDRLRINNFHSALALFREPWYAKGGKSTKSANASSFWGAEGPAGRTAEKLKKLAFHPFGLSGNSIDDYRDKRQEESQFATFLANPKALANLREEFSDDSDLFYALEALDVSDLIREMTVWITRENDKTGDVGFADLSDGERQLLMVLGLIRISRGKRVLFLLDEPDTHLNPHWQLSYLKLIEDWTGIAANKNRCQVILSTHNPLTISALSRDEIRILTTADDGRILASPPFADPKGMGFTATLTEIFGLPSTLDIDTQRLVDERNALAHKESLNEAQTLRLGMLNEELSQLGFLFDNREPLYKDFLLSWHDLRYADRQPMTSEQVLGRRRAMTELLRRLTKREVEN
ncbi:MULTISPECIES: AAA family ATPase [unclassified Pseudomonas]|uniref:AAA family ATPase n=1 Tax=unclassified Pseudomonas TaxID=196821 RepID=UPI000C87B47C|nr:MULTISPECIES: AAA family ATPase [unclassified Pseudomonas]PMU10194.1 AAA family ATPase [Pseudomonas sp. FW305-20]PMU19065.1 AAA family ATPase [Pseudomonas sp. FW305-122]PMU42374.1 AAA family ATPase [Pseudomonas sp. FW305-47B]PMX62769.1 AAA family ATPase [Pseudomonas sp. FW305-33]PMX68032.1 AAA family ATPase [Pseudomonas sp. FW305-60]